MKEVAKDLTQLALCKFLSPVETKAYPELKASSTSPRENHPTTDGSRPKLEGWISMVSSQKFASRSKNFKSHPNILNQMKHVCNKKFKKNKQNTFRRCSREITSTNVICFPSSNVRVGPKWQASITLPTSLRV